MRTAIEDLRGVARLAAAGPVVRFMGVGVLSTIAYAVLYLLLHGTLGAGGANAVALALTAVANTAANRRLTFGVRGRDRLLHHHARGAVVYVLTLGLTTLALASLHRIDPSPSRGVELAVLVVAGAAATITRYLALRTWVFARARAARERQPKRPAERLRSRVYVVSWCQSATYGSQTAASCGCTRRQPPATAPSRSSGTTARRRPALRSRRW